MDWAEAVEKLENRIETLDRNTRSYAVSIADQNAKIEALMNTVQLMNADVETLKGRVDSEHTLIVNLERNIRENYSTSLVKRSINLDLETRLETLTIQCQYMQDFMDKYNTEESRRPQTEPEQFNLDTPTISKLVPPVPPGQQPQHPSFEVDPLQQQKNDAWAMHRIMHGDNNDTTGNSGAATTDGFPPRRIDALDGRTGARAEPRSTALYMDELDFKTTNVQSILGHDRNSSPLQAAPVKPPGLAQVTHLQMRPGRHEEGSMGCQKLMSKPSNKLKVYSGSPIDFDNWAKMFVNHMARVHIHWRYTLNWLSTCNGDLSFDILMGKHMGPLQEPAEDLAIKLEATLLDYLPESLCKRRIQLSGGVAQECNGFTMWRRLHRDFQGSGDAVEYAGTEALREYGRCNKISELSAQMDRWLISFRAIRSIAMVVLLRKQRRASCAACSWTSFLLISNPRSTRREPSETPPISS